MSLQRTSERGHLKGCQVGLVCLGPGAAAWAAHRVSQVCLSALEVDQSTSECEGGDSKKQQSIYSRLYHVTQWAAHLQTTHTSPIKSIPVVLIQRLVCVSVPQSYITW